MTRSLILILLTALLLPLQARQPNIIVVLVDDLGKEWLSCYGSEDLQTPNIDQLAKDGMKFNNAYSMPQCTPSRVSLLTGQYPNRHGWVNHWDVPRWGKGAHFDTKHYTSIAQIMKQTGYSTCAAGKWQIDDFRVEPNAMRDAGFDAWCMWTGAEGGNIAASSKRYWDPYIFKQGGSKTYTGAFGPDLYAEFIHDFISDQKDKPFFVYWPMALTHTPFVHTPLHPNAKTKLDKHKAMVLYTDLLVKRLRDHLDSLQLRDDTLIIFTTDNGTVGSITGKRNGQKIRGGKTKLVEPGINAPFIACWPRKIKPGMTSDTLIDFTDFLPTCSAIAGTEIPNNLSDGHSFLPSLLDAQAQGSRKWIMAMGSHPAKYSQHRVIPTLAFKPRSLRDQRWKVQVDQNRQISHLHDLHKDPWEKVNLLTNPEAAPVLKRFEKIVASLPAKDAAPLYDPNPKQDWEE